MELIVVFLVIIFAPALLVMEGADGIIQFLGIVIVLLLCALFFKIIFKNKDD